MATKFYDKDGKPITARAMCDALSEKGIKVPDRWLEQAAAEDAAAGVKAKDKAADAAEEGDE